MSQSKGALTCCQQLVYITEWFTEMSELQTQDFMKYLLNKYAKSGQQLDNQLVNGFSHMGMTDRPASIFQCRMKLFTEWFLQWSDEEKQELLIRLRNIDSKFMDEFQSNVESNSTGGAAATDDYQSTGHTLNGNIDDDSKSSEQLVMNGVTSEQKPDLLDFKVSAVDVEVSPPEEEGVEQPVEQQPIDLLAAHEVSVAEEVVEEEECLMKGTDEPTAVNESSPELQEVCG